MAKYEEAVLEIIAFDAEDVITASDDLLPPDRG